MWNAYSTCIGTVRIMPDARGRRTRILTWLIVDRHASSYGFQSIHNSQQRQFLWTEHKKWSSVQSEDDHRQADNATYWHKQREQTHKWAWSYLFGTGENIVRTVLFKCEHWSTSIKDIDSHAFQVSGEVVSQDGRRWEVHGVGAPGNDLQE